MISKKFIFLFFFLSCASSTLTLKNNVPYNDVFIKTDHFYELIPDKHKIVQYVSYTGHEREESAQVIFVKKEELKISVLSTMGVEILSLTLDENTVKKEYGLPGIKMDFFYRVMSDMLAVYAQKTLLLKSIGPGITIKDFELRRELVGATGNLFEISYDNVNKWPGEVKLVQKQQNYSLKIKTIMYESIY